VEDLREKLVQREAEKTEMHSQASSSVNLFSARAAFEYDSQVINLRASCSQSAGELKLLQACLHAVQF
jgi:hypothetical protein